jgi:dUTPase
MSQYRLELVVTEEGAPFYPPVGTVETFPDNVNAGYDLKVVADQPPTTVAVLVPLGVRARLLKIHRKIVDKNQKATIVESYEPVHFSLEPRSSIYKTGFIMANTRGIIDRTYTGELKAPMVSVGTTLSSAKAGTRLFQIVAPDMGWIREVTYVESLPETVRGEGGFGSTGTN